MPRGPRRNLRPVPARKSQRSAATSTANCPTAWQASIRYGTPSSAHTSPTAPASCTNPELVGTQLSATRRVRAWRARWRTRSEEHTSELQSRLHLVCRLLLEKKKLRDLSEDRHAHNHDARYH